MTKVETIFQKELNLIHDTTIRDFVTTCFDKLCPDYFWTCPCSTTGKYHPQVSLGVGGLVRHTQLAGGWGSELMRALGTSSELKDITTLQDEIIATLLLHDLIKNGKGLNAQGYPLDRGVTGTHGTELANKIANTFPPALGGVDQATMLRILDGVACHMGIWTTQVSDRPNNLIDSVSQAFANLIHLADYCASRKVDSIYSKLENCNDTNKQTTNKTEVSKSPPCPGIRKTESRQTTDSETNSQ